MASLRAVNAAKCYQHCATGPWQVVTQANY